MLKSMTAYGRATLVSPLGRFTIEIQSVNRKHLEVNSFLPSELMRYDADIKKWVATEVGRGQINVKLNVVFDRESPLVVTPNLALAKQLKSAWKMLANELNLQLEDKTLLKMLARQENLLLYDEDLHDEEKYRQVLQEVLTKAMQQFLQMKHREGDALYRDITLRFSKLSQAIKEIGTKASGATTRYRQRLSERIEEAMGKNIENEERILREVCVYAEKVDIAEELTRFDSHLQQVSLLLETTAPQGIGKTLEFLVQELNREINTISSKSADVDISRLVIEIKTELERIREQIQNIE